MRVRRVLTRPRKIATMMPSTNIHPDLVPRIQAILRRDIQYKAARALKARKYYLVFDTVQERESFLTGQIVYLLTAYVHIYNPQVIKRRPAPHLTSML